MAGCAEDRGSTASPRMPSPPPERRSAALAAHARPPQEAVAITIDSARRRCPSLPYAQHRVANPKRLHQPDGRNAVAFRRETLGASAALAAHARPPQERRSPEQALHRRRVASVGLHHGDGLAKLSWGSVSVTLRPLVPAEISTLGLAPVRPSKSSGVVARLPRWPILARLRAAT
jgi:hypothetical protein